MEALEPRHLLSALTLEVTGAKLKESFNKAFKNAQVATFTSSDTTLKATAFTATINWGDGVTTVGTIKAVKKVPGKFDVIGGHTYKAGLTQQTPTITINDPSAGATASSSANVNVSRAPFTEVPVSLTAVAGGPIAQPYVAEFDSHVKKFSATQVLIDWNDGGSTMTGTVVPDPSVKGRFDVIPSSSHNFSKETDYPVPADAGPNYLFVAVTCKIGNGAVNIYMDPKIFIADAPITPNSGSNTITPSLNVNTEETVGAFTDADPNGKPKDFNVTVNWGDKTPPSSFNGAKNTLGEIFGSPDLFSVLAYHTYTTTGNYTITTTVTDIGGAPPITLKSTANVVAVPATIQLHGLPDATVGQPIGGPADPDSGTMNGEVIFGYVEFHDFQEHEASDFNYTIDWGDGTPLDTSARLVPIGPLGSTEGHSFIVYASHTYEKAGDFTVTLNVLTTSGTVIATAAYNGPQNGEITRQEPVYPPNS